MRRTSLFLLIPAVSCFAAPLALGQDSSQAPIELRYAWPVGQKIQYEIRNEMRGSLDVGVGDVVTNVPLDYKVAMQFALTCNRRDSQGRHFASLQIPWIRIEEMQGGGKPTVFDTRKPGDIEGKPLEPLYEELLRMVEEPLEITVTNVGDVRFTARARERLSIIGGPLDPAQLKVELQRIFPDVPEEKVKVGSTWTSARSIDMPTLGDVDLTTTHKLDSLSEKEAQVSLRFKPEFDANPPLALRPGAPQPMTVRKASGTQRLERNTLLMLQHRSTFDVEMNLEEKDLKLRGTLKLSSTLERVNG